MYRRFLSMALVAGALMASAAFGVKGADAQAAVNANAGGPYGGGIGQSIQLTGAESTGRNLNFSWRFSDGSTQTGPVITKSFGTAGTHTATLTVTDANGQSSTSTAQINVGGTFTGAPYTGVTSYATYGYGYPYYYGNGYGYGYYPYGYYGGYGFNSNGYGLYGTYNGYYGAINQGVYSGLSRLGGYYGGYGHGFGGYGLGGIRYVGWGR